MQAWQIVAFGFLGLCFLGLMGVAIVHGLYATDWFPNWQDRRRAKRANTLGRDDLGHCLVCGKLDFTRHMTEERAPHEPVHPKCRPGTQHDRRHKAKKGK